MEISLAHESWLLGRFDSRDGRHFSEMQDDGDRSDGAEAGRRTNRSDDRLSILMLIFYSVASTNYKKDVPIFDAIFILIKTYKINLMLTALFSEWGFSIFVYCQNLQLHD
jgi:hypothetical protein